MHEGNVCFWKAGSRKEVFDIVICIGHVDDFLQRLSLCLLQFGNKALGLTRPNKPKSNLAMINERSTNVQHTTT